MNRIIASSEYSKRIRRVPDELDTFHSAYRDHDEAPTPFQPTREPTSQVDKFEAKWKARSYEEYKDRNK